MNLFEYDALVRGEGYRLVCGVDEAGRGPLAGPVYAAAVILPTDCEIKGLDDSKKLTGKKREALFHEIVERAVAFCIADASRVEIDELNILRAAMLAMRRAVEGLASPPDIALVDGNCDPGLDCATRTVVGGDGISAVVAAASILAKVARDRHMLELDLMYPHYGLAAHKGYGTKRHYEALDKYGPCPEHRRTFLKKWAAAKHDG